MPGCPWRGRTAPPRSYPTAPLSAQLRTVERGSGAGGFHRHVGQAVRRLADETGRADRIHRLRKQEALAVVAAELLDPLELLGPLDTLGHRLELHGGGELHYRPDECRLVVAASQARHEGSVDLEDVDGEAGQVAERGIPGAEVVERQLDAKSA